MVEKNSFDEIKKALTPNLAIEEASRCLLCHDAPCSKACPAGTDPARFIRSLRFRNLKGAVETIRINNPLGAVCARVCPYDKYCEGACSRSGIDKPIKIGELQTYLTDFEQAIGMKVMEKTELDKEKVAIIGSGPSGLAAGAVLAQKGYKVTIFDENEVPGGWLSYGIPDHRLPQSVVENEIGRIKELGVDFKTNVKVGKQISLDDLRAEGYKAFLVACGLHKGRSVEADGLNLVGVVNGTAFLGEAKTNAGNVKLGSRVIVVGGGDVAMDCASTAKLFGADDVKIVYRRTIEKMPASAEERHFTLNTLKIPVFTGFKPVEIMGKDGKVASLKAEGMFDESKLELPADMVILAVGQEAEDIDSLTGSNPGDVFTAGDLVEKDKTVVQSVASGKSAAEKIEAYLTNQMV
jgi:dihydropyrimidine dehydrogenase (NAD+) subunit PreT